MSLSIASHGENVSIARLGILWCCLMWA